MLKLKKIQILGFKSFCDRTELTLPGQGIAVVVGPNGCGKSNILDGVTWVLGEQSAKTLRGGKMEDVIFAGTRDRRPLGMAEVSLTLVDPEAYSGPLLDEPEIVVANGEADWDEEKLRAARTEEVEQIIAESQPGQAVEGEGEAAEGDGAQPVVLKIRRRKFQRVPRQGEIVITRRLFRTGDSEYLLNGKLCRLRDIQDIFMGTGLGPESYAIIGQERIGQLLSSKPHDRRAIIEEAAGVTRFKTKKRLAELRLEQARQNLGRLHDIFEEVTRQLASLKRQAAKAERYGALREEWRGRLRVVLASRIAQLDGEAARLANEIATLTVTIDERAAALEALGAEHAAAQARGYELDALAKQAQARAHAATLALERARTRQHANGERLADLQARSAAGTAEREQAREQLDALVVERETQRGFLAGVAGEAAAFREQAGARQGEAREAAGQLAAAEARVEAARRQAAQLLSQANAVRNHVTQVEASLGSLEAEAERLANESGAARRDLDALGAERGQISMRFETAGETLKRVEAELVELRGSTAARGAEERELRRRGDELRSERAHLSGRKGSLENLLREHLYSTDTVRKLFRAQTLAGGLKPVGTLADFLEVGEQYESVVDEFLRDELNYIVVKSWDAAEEGVRLLKTDVDGRATFLVHPSDAQAKFSFEPGEEGRPAGAQQSVVGLKDCIRVLDGFGSSLEVILPKLRDGYVTPDADTARTLALQNPQAFFLAPTGECFHNVTVTGGKPRAEGPLALKRELRTTEGKLAEVERELAGVETRVAAVGRELSELQRQIESKNAERRTAEHESAQQSAALRQTENEVSRLERRLADWQLATERNRSDRAGKADLITKKRDEVAALEAQHAQAEGSLEALGREVVSLRTRREEAQGAAARMAAELAGLEERKRGAEASFARTDRLVSELERRVAQLDAQLAANAGEAAQRAADNEALAREEQEQGAAREAAESEGEALGEEARALRERLASAEGQLKTLRVELEAAREGRGARSTAAARIAAESAHAAEAAQNDLGVEADALRADPELASTHLSGDTIGAEDKACRELKAKLEAMGPVNMMALEEYKETEARHLFLETQRKDLLDSIENTRSTIRELDAITREKFNEAFARINENFARTFTRLFNGGGAMMRLTDEENAGESGIDIIASPPGKKLQNVFLLSGGEKALTALSLLMGIFEFQPAPFCVLDEVDAPLDETNVGRLAEMLRSMAGDTQFVMVTHSKRMMTAADMIYGVTMQEPGVSKLVSVRLGGQEHAAGGRRATA